MSYFSGENKVQVGIGLGLNRMPISNLVRSIFSNNAYDGFILDASDISTLYQVSTGTTPVTAVTQPIGLMLDKHLGMQFGPELVTNGGFDTSSDWTFVQPTSGSVSISGGKLNITSLDGTMASATPSVDPITTGKYYIVSVNVTAITGSCAVWKDSGATSIGNLSQGINTYVFYASIGSFSIKRSGVCNCTIESISVKLLDGNHPLQATAAARPTWQVDAGGHNYLQFLGTDDSLSCATGGGGSTGFLFCAALKPTGGAGTKRDLYSDAGANIGITVELDTANKLSISAGNGAAFTTLASTATVNVGTTYLLTAYILAGTMYVQINSATAESVAAPTITAGTAGFAIGKDNGAASDFLIADFYRATYIKNFAGAAAQIAAIQSWVKAGAGL